MSSALTPGAPPEDLAELLERLGNIPPERIRLRPPPGTATEADVLAGLEAPRKRLCEMQLKRHDYFSVGVRLVWEVDLVARTITVYTAPDSSTLLAEANTLDGGAVLPGFALPLREFFAELDRQG